ncbi:pilus assembly protein PilM [Candidatus Margulisiibacteriota bacterium]
MIIHKKATIIGFHITEETMYFACVKENKDGFLEITKLKSAPTPPHSFVGGKVKQANILSDQIVRILSSSEITAEKVVITFNDYSFIKHIDLFSSVTDEDLKWLIEKKLDENYSFVDYNLAYGFQRLPTQLNKKYSDKIRILYGFADEQKVLGLKDLLSTTGLNVYAMDMAALSVTKAITANNNLSEATLISVYLAHDFVDFNVLFNGEIIFSFSVKRDMEKLFQNEHALAELMQKIKTFIYSFENHYPNFEVSKFLMVSAMNSSAILIDEIKKLFPNYEIAEYDLKSNFPKLENILEPSNASENIHDYVPAIGAACKYFEIYNKTLSLIKVERQIAPIINPWEFSIAAVTSVGLIFAFFLISFYLKTYSKSIDSKIGNVKTDIRAYNSGEYIKRQKELKGRLDQIDLYNNYKNETSLKAPFLAELSKKLPEDITFDSIRSPQDKVYIIIGSAYLSSSIYSFYQNLNTLYSNVEINKVSNIFDGENMIPLIKFEIKFLRK